MRCPGNKSCLTILHNIRGTITDHTNWLSSAGAYHSNSASSQLEIIGGLNNIVELAINKTLNIIGEH